MNIYLETETDFEHNGLGFLTDVLNASVTDNLNGDYSLFFEYKINGNLSEYLKNENIVKCKVADGTKQLFIIKSIVKTFNSIQVTCKHIFYLLLDNFLEDVAPTNLSGQPFLKWILDKTNYSHKFIAYSNISSPKSARYVRRNPVDCILGDTNNSMVNLFNGELKRDNFDIHFNSKIGTDNGVKLIVGKNITGINITTDTSSVHTRIMPQGFDGLFLPEKYIDSPLINSYLNPKIYRVEFSDIKYDPEDEEAFHDIQEAYQALREATQNLFATGIDKPIINVKVDWVELSKTNEYKDISNLERVDLGDTITIDLLGIIYKTRIIRTVYNPLIERITNFELGTPKANIGTVQNNFQSQLKELPKSILDNAINNATELLTKAMGGFVYKTQNELFIMDTNDVATAKKIWRWNINGLGYSSNGIDGPYETAITQDGKIVADFITAGKLDTNVIEGYESLLLTVSQTKEDLSNNHYSKNQIEQLILNSSTGLTNTFSEAGGNNILRNTNFSAKEVLEDGQNYEYWYGDVERQANNDAVNGYSIKLKTSSSETNIINKNGNNEITIERSNGSNAIEYIIEGKCLIGNNIVESNYKFINGFATTNTPTITSNDNFKTLYIPCEPNRTYIIEKVKSTRFSVSYTTEEPAIGMQVKGIVQNNENTKEIYITGEDARYLVILYYNSGTDTKPEEEIRNSIKIYLQESPKCISGITNLFDRDNVYVIEGFVNGNTGLFSEKTNSQKSFCVRIEPNTTYTITGFERTTNAGLYTAIPVVNLSVATKKVGGATSWTFTSGDNDKYLVCMYDAGNIGYTYNNIQLEKGSISHSYVPFGTWLKSEISNDVQKQDLLFNLNDNELCSIGEIKDTLEVVNGKLTKRIGKIVFTGTEPIVLYGTRFSCNLNGYSNGKYEIISNIYDSINQTDYYWDIHINTNNTIALYKDSGWDKARISINDNRFSNVDDFKIYLKELYESNNPLVIYYELPEENEMSLSPTNVSLFEGDNKIKLVEDIETNTSIKYNKSKSTCLLYQEQKVANGPYTLSFYYRIINTLANVKVKVNDTEYVLDETNWSLFQTGVKNEDGEYLTEPINIKENKIKVEFITDINNACEIYDIMLNYGSVKLAYSQNQNETITDTVNIGKGITITSSTSDVKFVANNDGIRTKTINNEVITEFTDKGMTTNEAVIRNEATMVGILRQKVGNQIWDCMI